MSLLLLGGGTSPTPPATVQHGGINTLLVRWQNGYLEEADTAAATAWGRIEGFLSTNATGEQEARRDADGILAATAPKQIAIAASYEDLGSTAPYTNYLPGDTIIVPDYYGSDTRQRVIAFSISEDEEGNPIYEPELGAANLDEHQWLANLRRTTKRMSNGTLGGRSASAARPVPLVAIKPDPRQMPEIPVWNMTGALTTGVSDEWECDRARRLQELAPRVTVAGSTDTTIDLKLNGTVIATATIAAGDHNLPFPVSVTNALIPGDILVIDVTAAGTGAEGLVVQIRSL